MADLIDRKKAMAEAFTIMIEGEPFEIVQMETLWGLPSERLNPCDVCKYNPPSAMDGKPCAMCPAEGKETE